MTLLRPGSVYAYCQTEGKRASRPSTKDKARGKLREVKGTIKKEFGGLINNPDLFRSASKV